MTDPQNYYDADGMTGLMLRSFGSNGVIVSLDASAQPDVVDLAVPTAKLLAMIDAVDPAAMSAYLRETMHYEPAAEFRTISHATPGVERWTRLVDRSVRGFNGPVTDPDLPGYIAQGIVEELTAERLDAVPEADSPDDVDEHPEPVITVTLDALAAAEQLGRFAAEIRNAFDRGLAR